MVEGAVDGVDQCDRRNIVASLDVRFRRKHTLLIGRSSSDEWRDRQDSNLQPSLWGDLSGGGALGH